MAEAQKIGIVDYLIKAVMKPDDIMSAVLRARNCLPTGRRNDNSPMDNDSLWREFLSEPQMTHDEFRSRCVQLNAAFFEPEGFVLLKILPSAHLSHRLRLSLVGMFAHRLETMAPFLVIPTEDGAVALAREKIQMNVALGALYNLACYVQDNFDEKLIFVLQSDGVGLETLREKLDRAARYLPQMFFFDHAALPLDASGFPSFPELEEAAHMLRRCAPLSAQMSILLDCADAMEQVPAALAAGWPKGDELARSILNQLHETVTYTGVCGLVEALAGAAERQLRQSSLSTRQELLAAIDYIEGHLSGELSIRQVSEVVGYHPAYFSSLFKQEMGMSYSKFLTTLRIHKAKEMLRENHLPMQAIAEACGFCDLSYFSHKFKCVVGMTPSEWRQRK